MRKTILWLLAQSFVLTLPAQEKFTDILQHSNEGEGVVVLHQSDQITALVNGTASAQVSASAQVPAQSSTQSARTSEQVGTPESIITEDTQGMGRKARVNGYRIQVYLGGNSRKSKAEALQMGSKVKNYVDSLSIYTHFQSPHWLCRVGDFRTYEEANEVLQQLRTSGSFDEAVIVKSKVYIYY